MASREAVMFHVAEWPNDDASDPVDVYRQLLEFTRRNTHPMPGTSYIPMLSWSEERNPSVPVNDKGTNLPRALSYPWNTDNFVCNPTHVWDKSTELQHYNSSPYSKKCTVSEEPHRRYIDDVNHTMRNMVQDFDWDPVISRSFNDASCLSNSAHPGKTSPSTSSSSRKQRPKKQEKPSFSNSPELCITIVCICMCAYLYVNW
ncbi:uncharacterized protein LOC111249463 isoform X2 [Varroa destructor]|uniref:Uncharacterized protein n=1 Tax=Varroa destructor TaxID=109461 RepID=A0A7M7K1U5_VARDE|nr:uncharacterized protein LOC111249463 isoform X2 [Varroa destructor]